MKSSDLCSWRRDDPCGPHSLGGIKAHAVGMAAGLGLGCDIHISTQGLTFEHRGMVVFPLRSVSSCCLEEALLSFRTFIHKIPRFLPEEDLWFEGCIVFILVHAMKPLSQCEVGKRR